MRRWVVYSVVLVAVLSFFFIAPVVYKPTGSVQCYATNSYASLSYAIFGDYGVLYTPTTGWLDFPPFYFHNVACTFVS